MKRRSRILLIVCCITALIVGAVFAGRNREPSYGGHSLSYWLVAYRTNWSDSRISAKYEAVDAVRQIGTNALPCLLDWARYQEPAWKRNLYMRLLKLSHKHHRPWIVRAGRAFMPCRPERPDTMAFSGFEILGPAAEPALPELVKLASDITATNTAQAAISCLARIGPAALPCLQNTLTNSNNPGWLRSWAAGALGRQENQTNVRAVLHILNIAAKDPDPSVCRAAANSIASIAPKDLP